MGVETTFDELKTHQRDPKIVLRSKLVDLVYQEIWGYLCCHYAIRTLMFEAADHAQVDTDRVSFVAALRFAPLDLTGARDFPPHDHDGLWNHVVKMLARRLNPPRRRRSNPRRIKRKMSKWHVKRRRHRNWPQRTVLGF